jgi:hypothetical protein
MLVGSEASPGPLLQQAHRTPRNAGLRSLAIDARFILFAILITVVWFFSNTR